MRIYSTNDFIESKFPKKEDFIPALEEFEDSCVLPFLGRGVVGSFSYGSVNRGDCNVASDIDYFMLISDEEHKKLVKEAAQKIFSQRKVFVQARVVHLDHAKAGMHRIDDSFRQHLEFTVDRYGHRGLDPLEYLARSKIPFKKCLQTSMGIYLMKLNNGFCSPAVSESAYLDFLKDVMEKPWHAMRVAIQHALGSVVPEGEDFEDTKDQLIRVYQILRYSPRLMRNIEQIRRVGLDYVQLLERRGKIDRRNVRCEYTDFLPRIEACYSAAYNFIDANARIMVDS